MPFEQEPTRWFPLFRHMDVSLPPFSPKKFHYLLLLRIRYHQIPPLFSRYVLFVPVDDGVRKTEGWRGVSLLSLLPSRLRTEGGRSFIIWHWHWHFHAWASISFSVSFLISMLCACVSCV